MSKTKRNAPMANGTRRATKAKPADLATEKSRRSALASVDAYTDLIERMARADDNAVLERMPEDEQGGPAPTPDDHQPRRKAKAANGKAKDAKSANARRPKSDKKAKQPKPDKPKRVGALDAAAQVLAGSDKPMRASELIAEMAKRNLWKSPGGATPEATLYAAIFREISKQGTKARFKKVERGLFTSNNKKGG